MIHVTPLSRLGEVVRRTNASHLVTLLTEGSAFERPRGIDAGNHLHLTMHDISEPMDGMTPPAAEHVQELIAFAQRWDRRSPLAVHCFAGISRSTAAAFAICCALAPGRDEDEVAALLRKRSPSATPNRLIVALADSALGRGGRMSAAIAAIGRGAEAFEGEPFSLEL